MGVESMKKIFFSIIFILSFFNLSAITLTVGCGIPEQAKIFPKSVIFYNEVANIIGNDFKINLVFMPFSRIIDEMNAGNIDGDHVRSELAYNENENVIKVNEPLLSSPYVVFLKNKSIFTNSIEEMRTKKVAVVIGNVVVIEYCKKNNIKPIFVKNAEQAFNMIDKNRLDIFIGEFQYIKLLNRLELKDLQVEFHEKPLFFNSLYLFVNKKHIDIVPLLENAIKVMDDSGRRSELFGN